MANLETLVQHKLIENFNTKTQFQNEKRKRKNDYEEAVKQAVMKAAEQLDFDDKSNVL